MSNIACFCKLGMLLFRISKVDNALMAKIYIRCYSGYFCTHLHSGITAARASTPDISYAALELSHDTKLLLLRFRLVNAPLAVL